jgi:hypothetical protein
MCGQDDTLKGTASSVDVATKENLDKLVDIGQHLLDKPESGVNWETGQSTVTSEKKDREKRSANTNKFLGHDGISVTSNL